MIANPEKVATNPKKQIPTNSSQNSVNSNKESAVSNSNKERLLRQETITKSDSEEIPDISMSSPEAEVKILPELQEVAFRKSNAIATAAVETPKTFRKEEPKTIPNQKTKKLSGNSAKDAEKFDAIQTKSQAISNKILQGVEKNSSAVVAHSSGGAESTDIKKTGTFKVEKSKISMESLHEIPPQSQNAPISASEAATGRAKKPQPMQRAKISEAPPKSNESSAGVKVVGKGSTPHPHSNPNPHSNPQPQATLAEAATESHSGKGATSHPHPHSTAAATESHSAKGGGSHHPPSAVVATPHPLPPSAAAIEARQETFVREKREPAKASDAKENVDSSKSAEIKVAASGKPVAQVTGIPKSPAAARKSVAGNVRRPTPESASVTVPSSVAVPKPGPSRTGAPKPRPTKASQARVAAKGGKS